MKGFGISCLLLILLSGSLGEEGERGLNREEEDGIGNGRERSQLSGSARDREIRNLLGEQDKPIEGGKPLSREGKWEKRGSRNLLGSLLHRRQPLRLPGVGTPRGFIEIKIQMMMAILIQNQVSVQICSIIASLGRDEVRAGWLESYSDLLSEWVKPGQVRQNPL